MAKIGDSVTVGVSSWGGDVISHRGYLCYKGKYVEILTPDGWRQFDERNIEFMTVDEDDPPVIIIRAVRPIDRFTHVAYITKSGVMKIIVAGCRKFTTANGARKHWSTRKRNTIAWTKRKGRYLYQTKFMKKLRAQDTALNKWSLDFVRKVEQKCKSVKKSYTKQRATGVKKKVTSRRLAKS